MKIIFYETEKHPTIIDVTEQELSVLVGGKMDIEEMINNTCVVWFKDAPIAKDRSKYHRNVCITKQIGGEIKTTLTPIYSNFFVCGYENGKFLDFPMKHKNEIMAMFGF